METLTILNQILILGILAAIGIIGIRYKILNETAKEVLEKLVFYITLPLLIVTKISSLEITSEILRNGVMVIVLTYLVLLIQILIGNISARLFKLQKPQATIHALHTFLGNIVFLGFPLLDALFPGGEAILYAALYQLVMNTVFWSYGIIKLNPDSKETGIKNLKKLANPNTIALCIGLLMMIFQIRFPEILQISLGGLGKTTLYLAMIYIGILLSRTKILAVFTKIDVLFLSLNKLILIPILLIILIRFILMITGFEMNSIAFSVVILEAAMPCMTILVILAKRFGADDTKAMENFVVSTILSILSLPLVIYLIQVLEF